MEFIMEPIMERMIVLCVYGFRGGRGEKVGREVNFFIDVVT